MLSSLRNFILALFISLLLFGIGGYFIVNYVQHINIIPTDPAITPSETVPITTVNPDDPASNGAADNTVFTALLVGIDGGESQSDEKAEADTIIIFNINARTKTMMISPLSCDMKVDAKGYTLRLGAVYAENGIDTLLAAVWSNTGLKIDYYCVFSYDTVKSLFDVLGDVEYDVPMDMYYKPKLYDDVKQAKEDKKNPFDPEDPENPENQIKPEIDLKAGKQPIDGEKAVELLRFKGYATGNEERVSLQLSFIKEVLRQKITLENLSKAKDIYNAVKDSAVNTNIDAKTFDTYTDLIFSLFTKYQLKEEKYPGEFRNEYGTMFYVPNFSEALKLYGDYRKPPMPITQNTTTGTTDTNDTNDTTAAAESETSSGG